MYLKTLLSAFVLALAVQSVRGKPSCCCPQTNVPAPCSNQPMVGSSATLITGYLTDSISMGTSQQRQPCLANQNAQCVPCSSQGQYVVPNRCQEREIPIAPPTTTTTTTTRRPTTTRTTTLAPCTRTALPKTNCVNGEIYPAYTSSCDQFLMCRDQVYVLMICPPGLGFNHQLKGCDWSANVPACRAK